MKSIIVTALVLSGLSVTAAQAQTAEDVVQVLTADAGNLGEAVAGYCSQSDEADRETQIAVGAGLAQAYQYFAGIGDLPSAGTISQITCTCERTPGDILNSYLAGLGQLEDEACSTKWRADKSDSTPSLFSWSGSGGAVTEN